MKLVFIFVLPSCSNDDFSLCSLVAILHRSLYPEKEAFWRAFKPEIFLHLYDLSRSQWEANSPTSSESRMKKSDLDFEPCIFDLSVGRITLSLFKSKRCMSRSESNVIKMVPSYSADLFLLCIENHCCLRSKLKSLWFLALQNQPSSGQVSWFLFIVLLIKLCTPYQLPCQSGHTLIVNNCSCISPFFYL